MGQIFKIQQGAAPFYFAGGAEHGTGVLCIHGLSATPQEMLWVGKDLAARGFTTHGVRLYGHGTTVEQFAQSTWQDWYCSVLDGYELLRQHCDRVMVTGLSLGGLLSLMLAANEHVEGVAVLAAPFYLENPSLPYSHILRYVAPIVFKSDRAQDPYDQFVRATQQRRGEDAIGRVAYFQFPSAALSELLKIAEALRPLLSQITAPTQLIYSTGDRTVPYGNLAVIKARLTSVTQLETITLNKSDHVLTLDQEHEAVIGHIGTFFEGLAVQQ